MLARTTFPRDYIQAARERVAQRVAAYRALPASAKTPEFTAAYFNDLVVVLDAFFAHRTRAVEKKDGNPLNEVRILAQSVLANGEVMGSDTTIRMTPSGSVLGLGEGDAIALSDDDFVRLADAFLADLEGKYRQ